MPALHSAVEKLNRAQAGFLTAADAIAASDWNTSSNADSWSAAQLVAHLCQVERGVLGYADRIVRKAPLHVPHWKRLHFPLAIVESRWIHRKTPIPIDQELLANKESMLAELRGVRERTLSFLNETHQRNLGVYYWPHPFLGRLNFYNWFAFVAAHQIRHTKQMVEIAQNIPKAVVA